MKTAQDDLTAAVKDRFVAAGKAPWRLSARFAASSGALVIAFAGLLFLSPIDARHLLEALLRLFNMPVAAEIPTPEVEPPKPIDVTLVPKPPVQPVPPPTKADAPPTLKTPPPPPPKDAQSGEKPAQAAAAQPPAQAAATQPPPQGGATQPPPQAAPAQSAAQAAPTPPAAQAAPVQPPPQAAPALPAAQGTAAQPTPPPTPAAAPQPPVSAADVATRSQGKDNAVSTSGTDAAASDDAATPGKAAPANEGLKVPVLKLALSAPEIAQLLATGAAVIVASSGEGKEQFMLGADGHFAAATASQLAVASSRGFPVTSANLTNAWSAILKRQDPKASFEFALHFSNAADAIIVGEQLDAVKAKGIDLDKELAAGHVVETDGAIDQNTLNFHIVGVSEH